VSVSASTTHISARLAWHDDGWNGRVCRDPKRNVHCVGPMSYPGDVIARERDLEWESSEGVAGRPCAELKGVPPCIYSVNAFAETGATAISKPPDFFGGGAIRKWELPPATSCVWPYEAMYSEEVADGHGYHDAGARREHAQRYFDALSPGRSLIFYYANYSNPFSEEEARRYVVVGVSRLKEVGDELFYDSVPAEAMQRHGGFVWARNVTSNYPDEGFRLPYHRFREDTEALERFLVVPANPRNFKYGSRHISDDDALTLVEQLLGATTALAELDREERWEERTEWLSGVIAELWSGRGLYPGLLEVLAEIRFNKAIPWAREELAKRPGREVQEEVFALLDGGTNGLPGLALAESEIRNIRRRWRLRDEEQRRLLRDVLPRFDLDRRQIERIVGEKRADYGVRAELGEIADNPYLLVEQYAGDNPDDVIPFAKVDNGALPAPDLGGECLAEVDDSRRLRALCVETLRRDRQHSFAAAAEVIHNANQRLSFVSPWKRHAFTERYLEVDEEELAGALVMRTAEERRYLYLRTTYEEEREVEEVLRALASRPDLELRTPLTEERWRNFLTEPGNEVREHDPELYAQVIADQAEVCAKVFRRPLCVICGGAGTGKTTVVRSLIEAIEHVDGKGSGIQLLAPTGKAADRLRDRTGRPASTVHSLLASQGFLNPNLTFRPYGRRFESASTYIVDEASMLDLSVLATLFRAIEWHGVKRLILVGDPSQLPPIGVGKAFADTIDWLEAESPDSVGKLTRNMRQLKNRVTGRGTGIIDLADLYVRSQSLDPETPARRAEAEQILRRVQKGGDVDEDLRVLYWHDTDELERLLLETASADAEADTGEQLDPEAPWRLWSGVWGIDATEKYERLPENMQVLSPYRGELFGVERLNEVLQHAINGHNVDRAGTVGGVTCFDKVIQIRNSSSHNPVWAYNSKTKKSQEAEAFNGELGFAKRDGRDQKNSWQRLRRIQVVLRGKNHLWLNLENAEDVNTNVDLAYAISIHKSQGSEFRRVYFVVPKHKQTLLTTELFYTGVTRARVHCTLLIEEDIGALLSLRRRERSQLARINSSLFEFEPLPDQLLTPGDWYEEGKIHEALSGHMVRSKSELVIANLLHERGVPFRYEKPLFAPDGTFYLPDFTVQAGGETWYWEHWGRLDLESYRNHVDAKRDWYERNFPGRLVETEESEKMSATADEIIRRLTGD
jgi:exodeoxyribonuclease V alpha subunit